MDDVVLRRIVVVDDTDVAEALRNDELTKDELLAYRDDGCPVAYELELGTDVDAGFLCAALGLEPGEENELADSDSIAMSWDPDAVAEMREHLKELLEDPEQMAADLIEHADKDPDTEEEADESEVVDVLERLDKGYEPSPDAHPATAAAALLVRHILAFRVAARNEAWVVSL